MESDMPVGNFGANVKFDEITIGTGKCDKYDFCIQEIRLSGNIAECQDANITIFEQSNPSTRKNSLAVVSIIAGDKKQDLPANLSEQVIGDLVLQFSDEGVKAFITVNVGKEVFSQLLLFKDSLISVEPIFYGDAKGKFIETTDSDIKRYIERIYFKQVIKN
jgi:hypothetical protein